MKLIGPCFSIGAKGTVGNCLTYSRAGGKSVGKSKSNPKQPNTEKQIGARKFMQLLIQSWSMMPTELRDWWISEAASSGMPPYQYYLKANYPAFNKLEFPYWGPMPVEEGDQPLPPPYPWGWIPSIYNFNVSAEYDVMKISCDISYGIIASCCCVCLHNDMDGLVYWNSLHYQWPLWLPTDDEVHWEGKCQMPLGTYTPLIFFLGFWGAAPLNAYFVTELTFTSP